jgi:hypothetical protein
MQSTDCWLGREGRKVWYGEPTLATRHTGVVLLPGHAVATGASANGTGLSPPKKPGDVPLTASQRSSVLMRSWTGGEGGNPGYDVVRDSHPALAFRLLCACGYKLRCEVLRYGECLGEIAFFDDKEASTTQGERLWDCPRCQDRLALPSLRS